MMQRVGKNSVVSAHFQIENGYPASVKYSEGERTVEFPTEISTASNCVHVFAYSRPCEWLQQFVHEKLA